jgi:hypothetical protein
MSMKLVHVIDVFRKICFRLEYYVNNQDLDAKRREVLRLRKLNDDDPNRKQETVTAMQKLQEEIVELEVRTENCGVGFPKLLEIFFFLENHLNLFVI